MLTNDLKKGIRVRLRNGWEAVIEDNLKGNTRLCTVYGYVTEMGSVYAHDIVLYQDKQGRWQEVEHTEKQLKFRAMVEASGF